MSTSLHLRRLLRVVTRQTTVFPPTIVRLGEIDLEDDRQMKEEGFKVGYIELKDLERLAVPLADILPEPSIDHDRTWSDGMCGKVTVTNGIHSVSRSWNVNREQGDTSQSEALEHATRMLQAQTG